jgi:ArsR family transcriptional regulator, arsenate/arsenite/antimonite-responsive transcriptional repressor
LRRRPSVTFDVAAASVVCELAWLLDLLVQTAHYAAPALDELDRSLLPGVLALRGPVKDRYHALWPDGLAGCPELMVLAGDGGCVEDDDPKHLLAWLSTLPRGAARRHELLTEATSIRASVRRRVERIDSDVSLRRAYRDLLAGVWKDVGPVWNRRGRVVVAKSSAEWERRLAGTGTAYELMRLMPPRHPLTRAEPASVDEALRRRRRVTVVPIYFCMSGGTIGDLGDRLLVGVPASALEPVRQTRDAAFVADRLRVLAAPMRVRILIHLMSAPSGVMEITRALRVSQPTVSEHIEVLARAGLVRRMRKGNRVVYGTSPRAIERQFEDAKATLSRWRVAGAERQAL